MKYDISDDEFIDSAKRFNSLPTVQQKVGYIFSFADDYNGLFTQIVRVIDGEKYMYGFEVVNEIEADTIAGTFIEFAANEYYDVSMVRGIDERLTLCLTAGDRRELLNAEKEHYRALLNNKNRGNLFKLAYDNKRLRRKIELFKERYLFLKSEENSLISQIQPFALGIAFYYYEKYLDDILEIVEDGRRFKQQSLFNENVHSGRGGKDDPEEYGFLDTVPVFLGEMPVSTPTTKPSYLGYALLHHYWSKYSKNEAHGISLTTKRRWANYHQISERELWKKVQEIDNTPHDPKPTHHNAKRQFEEQYQLILPMLQQLSQPAYNEVKSKLEELKRKK
jgi:hypothetical protein